VGVPVIGDPFRFVEDVPGKYHVAMIPRYVEQRF
jgi:hypothetical protein